MSFANPEASVRKAAAEICIVGKLLFKNDLFAESILPMKTREEKLRLSAVIAGNLIIAGWYFLVSLPVLLGLRLEVLTGESYAWSHRVMLISLFVLFLSLTLLAATFQAWKRRHFLKVTVACLATLAVLELYESAMLHITYGPLRLSDVSVYIRGRCLLFGRHSTSCTSPRMV